MIAVVAEIFVAIANVDRPAKAITAAAVVHALPYRSAVAVSSAGLVALERVAAAVFHAAR